MKLRELLKGIDYEIVQGNIDLEINNVEYDSRKVEKEDMFVCIKGFQADGHKYAKAAIEKEINAVVCEDDIETDNKTVTIIKTKDTRKALAVIGANLYDHPSKKMKMIGVTGTNGKTTTTAMLSQILIGSGFDPSAIIGGKLPFIGGNSYVGQSDIIVCEACEYVDTFLQLNPFISIILNIDADHLDYFKNLDNIKKSFNKFAKQTTGLLVINGDDKNTLDTVKDVDIEKITYGFGEDCDYRAVNISADKGVHEQFDVYCKGEFLTNIKLIVPGKHNIYNALAAIATAHYLDATPTEIAENIHKFGGVHRRFEILGTPDGITVADDFAHHPTELTATLNAAMSMGFNKVWAVFQPHTFSRTAILLDDFAEALKIPDVAIISEILPVRETNTYNIYSTDLGAKVPNSVCLDTFEEITDYVCKNAKEGDLILTMGGGNVYMCANMILNQLKYNEENK